MKLYQLPNGDWVRPEDVVGIKAHPEFELSKNTVLLARISIAVGDKEIEIECESSIAAAEMRDKIAADINQWGVGGSAGLPPCRCKSHYEQD